VEEMKTFFIESSSPVNVCLFRFEEQSSSGVKWSHVQARGVSRLSSQNLSM
jgi:hypothetical protein